MLELTLEPFLSKYPKLSLTAKFTSEPPGMEEAGCKIYSGAPTVSQTTG